jgi:hypothetical protein
MFNTSKGSLYLFSLHAHYTRHRQFLPFNIVVVLYPGYHRLLVMGQNLDTIDSLQQQTSGEPTNFIPDTAPPLLTEEGVPPT